LAEVVRISNDSLDLFLKYGFMEHTGSCAAARVARASERSGAMNNMLILRDGFVS
jgi:hypothetical protein